MTEQPLELEDESELLEVPAAELPVAVPPVPAAPDAPDAPPAGAFVVFVHWNRDLLQVAPSAVHLQWLLSEHQPSMPEPAVVAGWQV